MQKLIFILVFLPILVAGQKREQIYKIKAPGSKTEKKCKQYLDAYKKLPIEVRYNVSIEDGDIIFSFSDKAWFKKMFNRKFDGLAVDIIKRDQFPCGKDNQMADSRIYRGHLLPPLFKKELRKRTYNYGTGISIKLGQLPKGFVYDSVECNLLIVQRKSLCEYHITSYVDDSKWDLLDMGLYKDTLSNELKSKYLENTKMLSFQIPFKKNQAEFEESDIQPLYDSLKITEYNIETINIQAFTSVEGGFKDNVELQKKRAKSIVTALQSFQAPSIDYTIKTSENWREFYEDIQNTPFDYLTRSPKGKVKNELVALSKTAKMERILAPHRKAIISMRLKRKILIPEDDPALLVKFFNQSIKRKKLEQALYVQQKIYEQIKYNKAPTTLKDQLEIPRTSFFGPLINNAVIFDYERSVGSVYDHIKIFEELAQLIPGNAKIQYNLIAMKLKAWSYGESNTNRKEISSLIKNLPTTSIDKKLMSRLRINYNILLTEYLQKEQNYKGKRQSLRNVYKIYRTANLSDGELVTIAKYLSSYSEYKRAKEILQSRAFKIDASLALRNYFVSLTIYQPKFTKTQRYQTLLLKLVDENPEKFCKIFTPGHKKGSSFQLLTNPILKRIYCENCTN